MLNLAGSASNFDWEFCLRKQIDGANCSISGLNCQGHPVDGFDPTKSKHIKETSLVQGRVKGMKKPSKVLIG